MSRFRDPGKQPFVLKGTCEVFLNHSQGKAETRGNLGASVFRWFIWQSPSPPSSPVHLWLCPSPPHHCLCPALDLISFSPDATSNLLSQRGSLLLVFPLHGQWDGPPQTQIWSFCFFIKKPSNALAGVAQLVGALSRTPKNPSEDLPLLPGSMANSRHSVSLLVSLVSPSDTHIPPCPTAQ